MMYSMKIKLPVRLAAPAPKKPGAKKPVAKKPVAKKPADKKPTTRRKTAAKAPAKKSPAKTRRSKKIAKKKNSRLPGWLKWLLGFGVKVTIAVVAILLVVGIYLDNVVRDKFDGQLWNLPAVVYGRVLTLQPEQAMTLQEVRRELDLLQYHKVKTPQRIGEYSSSSTRIELIRRPFEFEDGHEGKRHVMLTFADGTLSRIHEVGSKRQLGYLRVEPKMLGMLGDQRRRAANLPTPGTLSRGTGRCSAGYRRPRFLSSRRRFSVGHCTRPVCEPESRQNCTGGKYP